LLTSTLPLQQQHYQWQEQWQEQVAALSLSIAPR
jgi:hypothetical protein